MDFFYDAQIRKYTVQFIRIFSDLYIQSDPDANGFRVQSRVPIKWGDMSRQVGSVISGNNENTVLSAPSMAAWIVGIEIDDDRRTDPQGISKITADERKIDPTTGQYGTDIGNRYSIERYMPVPYKLTYQLDIWTTNTHTKLQILEQILTVFNTSIQLQQNENPLDWSNIFEVFLIETMWTNRTIPAGTDEEKDIASLTFEVPIWINPPAIETKRKVIDKIITRVFDTREEPNGTDDPFGSNLIAQYNITSDNLQVRVDQHSTDQTQYIITLLNKYGVERNELTWDATKASGTIVPGSSRIILKTAMDVASDTGDVYGNIISVQGNKLTVTLDIDTMPEVNPFVSPIVKIVDGTNMWPGNGLPAAANGQRYLLSGDTNEAFNWGVGFAAHANDIIEFNGTAWEIVFDSANPAANKLIKNIDDSQYYTFDNNQWNLFLSGTFGPGFWIVTDLSQ